MYLERYVTKPEQGYPYLGVANCTWSGSFIKIQRFGKDIVLDVLFEEERSASFIRQFFSAPGGDGRQLTVSEDELSVYLFNKTTYINETSASVGGIMALIEKLKDPLQLYTFRRSLIKDDRTPNGVVFSSTEPSQETHKRISPVPLVFE